MALHIMCTIEANFKGFTLENVCNVMFTYIQEKRKKVQDTLMLRPEVGLFSSFFFTPGDCVQMHYFEKFMCRYIIPFQFVV